MGLIFNPDLGSLVDGSLWLGIPIKIVVPQEPRLEDELLIRRWTLQLPAQTEIVPQHLLIGNSPGSPFSFHFPQS